MKFLSLIALSLFTSISFGYQLSCKVSSQDHAKASQETTIMGDSKNFGGVVLALGQVGDLKIEADATGDENDLADVVVNIFISNQNGDVISTRSASAEVGQRLADKTVKIYDYACSISANP